MEALSTKKQEMHVMLLIDNNYVYFSLPFMLSLIVNNKWALIKFHIVSDDLDESYKKYIVGVFASFDVGLEFINVDTSIFKSFLTVKQYPALLYYKMLPHYCLGGLDRAMFFDTDMIVTQSLETLYNLDIGDNYFAAAYGVLSFTQLIKGITEGVNANFMNSGVMLLNLSKFKKENITIDLYLDYAKKHKQTLFEEWFLNNIFYKKIYPLMPYDYNYNVGISHIYKRYLDANNIEPKKAIYHYMNANNRPIIKPWDAYEYFFYGKQNDIFSDELYSIYAEWWAYAKMLPVYVQLDIINQVKLNKLRNTNQNIIGERDIWLKYYLMVKHLITSGLLKTNLYGQKNLQEAMSNRGHKKIAIYGYMETTKILISALKDTKIEIKYIVENIEFPDKNIKRINRMSEKNNVYYPPVDLMLIADIYNYHQIISGLKKIDIQFEVCNAVDYVNSLTL